MIIVYLLVFQNRAYDVVTPRGSLELDELNKAFKQFEFDELTENFDVTRTTTSHLNTPTREPKSDRQLLEAFHELVDEISKEAYTKEINEKATTEKYYKATLQDLDVDKGSGYIEDKTDNDLSDQNDLNDHIENAYSEISKNLDSVELLTKDLMKAIDSEYPGIFNDSETNYGDIDYPERTSFRTPLSDNDTLVDLKNIVIQEELPVISLRKKPDLCNVLDLRAAVLSSIPTLPEVRNTFIINPLIQKDNGHT